MTAKISASADGTKVYLGNASENALEIDATGKTIKPVTPYKLNGNGPAFAVSGVGGITVNTTAKVTGLLNKTFDTNNCFADSRFTPNVPGYYQIQGGVGGDGLNGAAVFPKLYKNGAEVKVSGSSSVGTPVNFWAANVAGVIYLNGTTDYVELWTTIVGTPNSVDSCSMSGAMVRQA